MTTEKKIICITCPQGCLITVKGDAEKGTIESVEGFTCKRGKTYAENEFIHPLRILTSSVKVSGADAPLVPVRTRTAIPKELLFKGMEEIRKLEVPQLFLLILHVSRGGGDFAGKGIFSGYHKAQAVFLCPDDTEGVFFLPFLLERFAGEDMEVYGNTGFFQLFDGVHVIIAPAAKVVNLLLQLLDIYLVVIVSHEHAAGKAHDVSIDDFRLDVFRDFGFPQTLDVSVPWRRSSRR